MTLLNRLITSLVLLGSATAQDLNIKNDIFWDTKDGKPLYSQSGGIFKFKDPKTNTEKYFWYGIEFEESARYRNDPSVTITRGNRFKAVTCYTSTDLVNWESQGEALTREEAYKNGGPSRWPWIARMGVAYFEKDDKYVMVTQYGAGIFFAVSDSPAGPFKWHNRRDMTETIGTPNTGDQTVFIDEDTGKSYLVYSYGKGRHKIYISEIGLKDGKYDLLDCTQVYRGSGREGNCMFKYKGTSTDPLLWSDGSGRVKEFEEWRRRRAEIKAEIEHYEIGKKPGRPEKLKATYKEGMLKVEVTVKGETLTLSSRVSLPEGEGPFPAVIGIGMGGRPGSLPPEIFSSRKVAVISFNFGEAMAHTQKRGQEPINKLYPELKHIGAYSAWSWGVSRLIDGLELVQDDLPLDLKRLGITGCSFAGKMALFAGAFDERIALTIAQEPGGGGAAAWRVSETLGKVEKLGATSRAWFMEEMFQFSGGNVAKLPMDHHELMAMVAPRALLVLGNPDFTWLAEESGYVSCRAAHEVWKEFGIGDRFGFSIIPGHGHCQLPEIQKPEVEAFVDKFLLGRKEVNTEVTLSPYELVDHSRWIAWWGKEKPFFPKRGRLPLFYG